MYFLKRNKVIKVVGMVLVSFAFVGLKKIKPKKLPLEK